MRYGQNPVKSVEEIAAPAPVTVVIISYIPFLSGYYEQGLEVLKRCIGSIAANTEGEYDLLVFDNASCTEVTEYLLAQQSAGVIDFLFLSERNLGKSGAWNMAFAAAPGKIIAYADSDVYFHPGWLPKHLEALKAFPNAGMITGMPLISPEKFSQSTLAYAEKTKGVTLERGDFLSFDDLWRHARSLGMSEEDARTFFAENQSLRISQKDQHYYVGAGHFQFAAPKEVLQSVLPLPAGKPMGRVRLLDEAINAAGYLRLSLSEWTVHHMGNSLDDEDLASPLQTAPQKGNPLLIFFRPLLQWLYNKIFRLLYRS